MEPAWGHGATAGPRDRPGRRDDVSVPWHGRDPRPRCRSDDRHHQSQRSVPEPGAASTARPVREGPRRDRPQEGRTPCSAASRPGSAGDPSGRRGRRRRHGGRAKGSARPASRLLLDRRAGVEAGRAGRRRGTRQGQGRCEGQADRGRDQVGARVMAKFFIDRPIVAMVISILVVIVGLVALAQLPIAQYPNIAPPEMLLTANYPGADAVTLEQSVATPIEQQMSGVDNMLYMYSTSQTSGNEMNLRVSFDITTDPNIDQ